MHTVSAGYPAVNLQLPDWEIENRSKTNSAQWNLFAWLDQIMVIIALTKNGNFRKSPILAAWDVTQCGNVVGTIFGS